MERIKSVVGFEGMYEVSGEGVVYKTSGKNVGIMRQHIINSGYKTVYLYKEGKLHTRLVHRLVAKAFCEGYEEGLVVNHMDGDRLNNRYTNLEWVTQRENVRDSMKRGTHDYKSAHKVAHELRKKPVEIECEKSGEIRMFDSAREASRYIGVHENNVSRVARGERTRTMGFLVKYI